MGSLASSFDINIHIQYNVRRNEGGNFLCIWLDWLSGAALIRCIVNQIVILSLCVHFCIFAGEDICLSVNFKLLKKVFLYFQKGITWKNEVLRRYEQAFNEMKKIKFIMISERMVLRLVRGCKSAQEWVGSTFSDQNLR